MLFGKWVETDLLREYLTLPLVPSRPRALERWLKHGMVEDWTPRLLGSDVAT